MMLRSEDNRTKGNVTRDEHYRLLQHILALFFLFSFLLLSLPGYSNKKSNLALLRRVHTYATTLDTTHIVRTTYAYVKTSMRVDRRNPILMLVPSAYVIAHGKERQFFSEGYLKIEVKGYNDFETTPLLRVTTIPHRRHTMETFSKYMTPTIYGETIIGNTILSPFHPNNFRFYKYRIDVIHGDVVEMRFRGRRKSTQLVKGTASIDKLTGRIINCNFVSEYDMVHSWVSMEMGERGFTSLFPKNCEALFRFRFLGNKVSAHCISNYGLPQVLPDSIKLSEDPALMAKVRPDTLDESEQNIYKRKLTKEMESKYLHSQDTVKKRKSWTERILWDAIGDNVLNRIKTHFGQNSQGYMRMNPVLNPLYMSYSNRRGFTYKFDIRASYQFNSNSEINGRFKSGYSFGLHQFYFRLPIYYYMSKRRNRYIKFEIGNGNRIRSNAISKEINEIRPDQGQNLLSPDIFNEFRSGDARLVFNFDINDKIGFQVGAMQERFKAVNPYAFHALGKESFFSSFAPLFEIQYRPWGWNGPIFTADYDRGIKGVLSSNTEHERYELNAEYIYRINRLQSLQMRLGSGFYSNKGRNTYFLTYENFRENNIPGGWNDDWSGEFELLRSDTYNMSPYYVRANLTYESPLMFLSWLPIVGHYMEMERIYVSWLDAENVHPYLELGYGFTTRLFSLGLFVSNGKGNRTVGCKFGFELFRHW